MNTRDFIQETIDMLRKSADKIEEDFSKFKNGEIDKEKFEEEYRHVIVNWVLDGAGPEEHYPNNDCKYSDTLPDNEYFKKMNV